MGGEAERDRTVPFDLLIARGLISAAHGLVKGPESQIAFSGSPYRF